MHRLAVCRKNRFIQDAQKCIDTGCPCLRRGVGGQAKSFVGAIHACVLKRCTSACKHELPLQEPTPQQACPVLDTTKDEGSPALAHRSASARRREVRDRCLPAEALRRQGRGVFQPPD